MSSLPLRFEIVLLGGLACFASLVACGPAVETSGATAQMTGTNSQPPKTPLPARVPKPPASGPAKSAAKPTGPAKTEATKSASVKIDNFAFEPASLTVAKGTTVEWINHDDVPHTVVENKVRFKSAALDTDDRFRHTFTSPGTYHYFCSVHPHMTGEILVKP
jgi:plastocyanin